jgi:hypothetical protein
MNPRGVPRDSRIPGGRIGPKLVRAQVALGTTLLIAPRPTTRRVVGGALPPEWTLRLLAARTLTQGVVEIVSPHRRTFQAGAAVDGAHAMTMLAAARIWPTYRRAALLSAATATISAVAGVATSVRVESS